MRIWEGHLGTFPQSEHHAIISAQQGRVYVMLAHQVRFGVNWSMTPEEATRFAGWIIEAAFAAETGDGAL